MTLHPNMPSLAATSTLPVNEISQCPSQPMSSSELLHTPQPPELWRTKTRKDNRLLRDLEDQLCQVVLYIFNLNLSLEKVPALWKTSPVVAGRSGVDNQLTLWTADYPINRPQHVRLQDCASDRVVSSSLLFCSLSTNRTSTTTQTAATSKSSLMIQPL